MSHSAPDHVSNRSLLLGFVLQIALIAGTIRLAADQDSLTRLVIAILVAIVSILLPIIIISIFDRD